MIATLEPKLVASLQAAAREILETMVFLPPTEIGEVLLTTSVLQAGVTGLLPFTGTRKGTFAVSTTETLARTVAAKMLMMEPGDLGSFQEAADAFGEVVNMIGGNFKNAWVAEGNRMDLSTPQVVHNGEISVNSDKPGSLRSGIRVVLPEGELLIGVHFEAST